MATHAHPDLPPRALQQCWGVTRIGRITGLDRVGVEVACAVRPRGHVLQTANGKGWSFRVAARAALSEAAELEASERVDPTVLRWASIEQMRRRFGERAVWGVTPWLIGRYPNAEVERLRLAWIEGRLLQSNRPVWLPAAAIFCPPPGAFGLSPVPVRWTSNGIAAHPQRSSALRHALLELAERDGLARTLPQGWTVRGVRESLLSEAALARISPRTERALRRIRAAGFELHLFLWPRGGAGGVSLPIGAALLFDEEGSPIPLTAGYGCGLSAKAALESAFLEAAQSRLTDIHGAREDVQPMAARDVARLRSWCRTASKSPLLASAPPTPPEPASPGALLRRFERSGHGMLASVELASELPGLRVVRLLSQTLLLTELL